MLKRSLYCPLLLGLTLTALTSEPARAADDDVIAALRAHRSTLSITADGLIGPGAAPLLTQARAAQFVLIGEDHGFSHVPAFAQALQRSLGADALPNLVVEVGPHSTRRAEAALRNGRAALTAMNREHPFALPFLSLQADADLAASFVRAKGTHLWGIDQEFVLSPALHIGTLQARARTDAQRAAVAAFADQTRSAYAAMVRQHDPSQMPLLSFAAADYEAMRQHFAGDAVATQLIGDLAHSAQIYRDQQRDPPASNQARATWMKRQFMQQWLAQNRPRAMFKLGAFHAGRGLSPIGVYDIGNLASELAESQQKHSLHVLVLAGGGQQNRWLPFIPDESAKAAAYDAHSELAVIAADALLDAMDGEQDQIFDCAALRHGAMPASAPAALRSLVYAYDFVVISPKGHAARLDSDVAPAP